MEWGSQRGRTARHCPTLFKANLSCFFCFDHGIRASIVSMQMLLEVILSCCNELTPWTWVAPLTSLLRLAADHTKSYKLRFPKSE